MKKITSKRVKILVLTICISLLCLYCRVLLDIKPILGLYRNMTESVSYRWFVGFNIHEIKRNMNVALHHPRAEYLLIKQVVGFPGDEIKICKGHVIINGKNCGIPLEKSDTGLTYTAIQEGFIPEGYFYVYSSHEKSFDSRYAEFGLVQATQMEKELWPLF